MGTFGAWQAFTLAEESGKVCYMYSRPTKEEGDYSRRSPPHAMVTRRQENRTVEEVSVTSGYPYRTQAAVELRIDDKTYPFTVIQDEHAWADDEQTDSKLVKSMIRGLKMTVRGTSKKGTFSLDSYSLKGFTKAHRAIVNACP